MGKKVKEYQAGDFIFAKVKGYPAWPARVQRMNGKKYFVYFYGTGETANLPPNMIFDYAENKDKFLTKTVKRRDFNDGVRQIEHDFANNVPLEEVLSGVVMEKDVAISIDFEQWDEMVNVLVTDLGRRAPPANDTMNDTANETIDDSGLDTTTADETMGDDDTNTTQKDAAVEDSDETGNLVIDEGKKGRKSKGEAKTPAKPKTPRGKAKKDEAQGDDEEIKREEEVVSRSGRKIRPKRHLDEQAEENASPMAKRTKTEKTTKPVIKNYNAVTQAELADLKEPFKPENTEKENLLIAYLPTSKYVGIKLFESRPKAFKNEAARLAWDKQSAANAITLKQQLERGQISEESIAAQLVKDLDLSEGETAALDSEREAERKFRVQFLRTEMKLIELDAKIKTCLCLEKADTDLCLKLLDELNGLEVKALMLLKHPTCLETVKRMRAYVGNAPSWDLSETAAITFGKQAHRIRKQADNLYNNMKKLFNTPVGLTFWEWFSERVNQFKKVTSDLGADEMLELVHEPLGLSYPSAHTMQSAVDAANELPRSEEDEAIQPEKETQESPKKTAKKSHMENGGESSSADTEDKTEEDGTESEKDDNSGKDSAADTEQKENEVAKNADDDEAVVTEENGKTQDSTEDSNETKDETVNKETPSDAPTDVAENESNKKYVNDAAVKDKDATMSVDEENVNDSADKDKDATKSAEVEKSSSSSNKTKDEARDKNSGKRARHNSKDDKFDKEDEPRAKRSREIKKTDAPPARSPAKRKPKA